MLRPDPGSLTGYEPLRFRRPDAGLALLVFIGSSLVGGYAAVPGEALRDILAWPSSPWLSSVGSAFTGTSILTDGPSRPRRAATARTALRADVKVEGRRSGQFGGGRTALRACPPRPMASL